MKILISQQSTLNDKQEESEDYDGTLEQYYNEQLSHIYNNKEMEIIDKYLGDLHFEIRIKRKGIDNIIKCEGMVLGDLL